MDPSEALAAVDKATAKAAQATATAPEAAQWLQNPTGSTQGPSLANQWAAEPQWEGPDEDEEDANVRPHVHR